MSTEQNAPIKKTNLFSQWKSENTSNFLGYGIHENVVIREVDMTPRKKQDGSVMKVSMFIKYSQVNENGNPLAEIEEFVFWPSHDSDKVSATDSAFYHMNRLSAILVGVGYTEEQISDYLNPFEELKITSMEDFEKFVKSRKGMDTFTNTVNKAFYNVCSPIMGLKSQYKVRLKVTYQASGRGVEVAKGHFIEPMQLPLEKSTLRWEPKDIKAKAEAEKPKTATSLPGSGMPSVPGSGIPGMPSMPGAPTHSAPVGAPVAAPVMPGVVPSNPVAAGLVEQASAPAPVAAPVQQMPVPSNMPFLGNQQ